MRTAARKIETNVVCAPTIDGTLISVKELAKNDIAVVSTHEKLYIIRNSKISRLQLKAPITKWHKAAYNLNSKTNMYNPKQEPDNY